MMPPHRRNFYTIIFFKDQKSGQISINENQHKALNNIILFQGIEHIFSFVRDESVEGAVVLFHKAFALDFLQKEEQRPCESVEGAVVLFHKAFALPFVENLEEEFPFFHVFNQNLFHLNKREQHTFEQLIQLLHEERKNQEVVKPLLTALLEKAKTLYAAYTSEEMFLSKKIRTVRKYKSLISNSFLENREVSFYADQLNVSANYLNEMVKAETGISAKRHISERVLLEAKNLLLYSGLDIAEISYALQFSEPTHFTKFFKKETGSTPKSFRNQKP